MSTPAISTGIAVHEIHPPRGEAFDPKRAISLVSKVIQDQGKNFAFRIACEPNQKVAFQILDFDLNDNRPNIEISVKGLYPKTDIDTTPFAPMRFTDQSKFHLIVPIRHNGGLESWWWQAVTPEETKGRQVANVAHTMAEAANHGATVYLNIFAIEQAPYDASVRKEDRRKILGIPSNSSRLLKNAVNIGASMVGEAINLGFERRIFASEKSLIPETEVLPPNDWQQKALAKADSKDVFKTIIILEVTAPTLAILSSTVDTIVNHLSDEQNSKENYAVYFVMPEAFAKHRPQNVESQADLDRYSLAAFINLLNRAPAIRQTHTSYLTTAELAALWHLPFDGMDESLVSFVSGNRPAKAILDNKQGIVIGRSTRQPIHLPDVDRQSHINIVGKNNVGKSSLMLNMIRQDIERGKGVCVIDPDGRLVNDILITAIPDQRREDVIVLDLAETKHPVPLNPLNIRDSEGRIASGLFADMLRRIYPEFDRAERAKSFLMGALGALNFADDPIIPDVVKLFEDAEFREAVINGHIKQLDKGTYKFWRTYASLSPANKRDYPYPVTHRLNSLISVEALQPILCHPQTLNWAEVMRDNRIVLISLNPKSDTVGEQEQQLLGTVALSMILSTARNYGERQPFDFYLYIDEVQRFINTPLNRFFEGVRKFGVYLTVANQFLGQLETGVLESLIGNVGATFIFEIGDTDARRLKIATAPAFDEAALMGLGKYHPAVKMRLNGQSYPAFDIYTEKPKAPSDSEQAAAIARANDIRNQSSTRWTPLTREAIMEGLDSRDPQEPIIWDRDDDERVRRNRKVKDIPPDTDKTSPASWGNG
jgi:hypothetical protein